MKFIETMFFLCDVTPWTNIRMLSVSLEISYTTQHFIIVVDRLWLVVWTSDTINTEMTNGFNDMTIVLLVYVHV